jgi:hypothetical protein
VLTSTIVIERPKSSVHAIVGLPARAAARKTSLTSRVNSGPIYPSYARSRNFGHQAAAAFANIGGRTARQQYAMAG